MGRDGMMYVLTRDGKSHGVEKLYWNRRKKAWQSYFTKGCVYPTHKGAAKKATRLCTDCIGEAVHITPLDSL